MPSLAPTQPLKNHSKPLESLTRPSQGILGIDPGPEESAWLIYDLEKGLPIEWAKEFNENVLREIDRFGPGHCAIECIQSFGMSVGQEVFETAIWVGRFIERWRAGHGEEPVRVYRKQVKLHLCGTTQAKDPNVRQALIDRYGPGKAKAIGLKASKGPLYGIAGDCWSALAVAITAFELGGAGDGIS